MIKLLFSAMFCLLVLTGCKTTVNQAEYDVNEHDLPNGAPALQELGNQILESIKTDDYSAFVPLVGNDGPEITETEFLESGKKIREQFGKITGYEYLADLEIPLFHNLLWKVQFERQGENQKKIRQELLFRLIVGIENGKTHVVGMGFL